MIEIKHLNAFYGDRKVLNDINASFRDGSITAITGPNGSGKSTLIKAILGLIDHTEGTILMDGRDRNELSLKEIARKASYLSQSRNVPGITAEKMVLHGRFPYLGWPRRYSNEDRKIVRDSMERTGCEELSKRMMTDLSGGERQKVYLAMALAQDTGTIFMDEPTTYLDPEHQLAVMESAKKLKDEGKTVVMVLHDLPLALENADFLLVMEKGQVRKSGKPDDIYESGIIEKVFNVRLERSGNHYHMEALKGER